MSLQVTANGIFSFGNPFPYHSPHLFPGTSFYNFLVAVYWTDNDISTGVGEVSYQVHTDNTETVQWVNTYISQTQQVNFNGTWMLLAEWKDVPQYLSSTIIVS